jgi:chemotaxis protein methyltransferase CheR
LASVSEVLALVMKQPSGPLARAAVEAMSVQETSFFRDRKAFEGLASQILPGLLAAGEEGVRIWSAGCGQGQEAYSLAMLVEEAAAATPVEILATDLSRTALEKAQSAIYTHFEVQRGLPIRRLLRHFEEVDDAWRVSQTIRRRVRWLRLNLIDPFRVERGYDLILCRHVVSNFAPDAREATLDALTRALVPGGGLMLGQDETPPPGFEPVAGAPCVYRRAAEGQAVIAA